MSSDAWQVGLRGQSSVRAFVRSRVRSFTVDKDALEEKAQAVVLPSKGRQFRLMRQATRLSATAASILKGARIKRMGDLPLALDRNYVRMEVEAAEELASLRMWEQGDEAMYTREALEQRYANRTHPDVWYVLNQWWWRSLTSNLLKGVEGEAASAAVLPSTRHPRGLLPATVERDTYVACIVLVCKALLEEGEEWDAAEARRLAYDAWSEDARGERAMSQTMFSDSIFELADQWTSSTDAQEYVSFLKRLHTSIFDGEEPDWRLKEDADDVDGLKPSDDAPSLEDRVARHAFHKQRRAAVNIQKKMRQKQGRKEFEAKKSGAIAIQASARGRPPRVDFGNKKDAVLEIQKISRDAFNGGSLFDDRILARSKVDVPVAPW